VHFSIFAALPQWIFEIFFCFSHVSVYVTSLGSIAVYPKPEGCLCNLVFWFDHRVPSRNISQETQQYAVIIDRSPFYHNLTKFLKNCCMTDYIVTWKILVCCLNISMDFDQILQRPWQWKIFILTFSPTTIKDCTLVRYLLTARKQLVLSIMKSYWKKWKGILELEAYHWF